MIPNATHIVYIRSLVTVGIRFAAVLFLAYWLWGLVNSAWFWLLADDNGRQQFLYSTGTGYLTDGIVSLAGQYAVIIAAPLLFCVLAPKIARLIVPVSTSIVCPKCNYTLSNLNQPRCPECGLPLTDDFLSPPAATSSEESAA